MLQRDCRKGPALHQALQTEPTAEENMILARWRRSGSTGDSLRDLRVPPARAGAVHEELAQAGVLDAHVVVRRHQGGLKPLLRGASLFSGRLGPDYPKQRSTQRWGPSLHPATVLRTLVLDRTAVRPDNLMPIIQDHRLASRSLPIHLFVAGGRSSDHERDTSVCDWRP